MTNRMFFFIFKNLPEVKSKSSKLRDYAALNKTVNYKTKCSGNQKRQNTR